MPQEELQEKDFIRDGKRKPTYPLWLWIVLFTIVVALFWGGSSWYYSTIDKVFEHSPFLRVTNREMGLFLWQNPQYMRINSKSKESYLTGFQYVDSVAPIVEQADAYVVAPPDVLFLYHTWNRLVRDEFTPRPIKTLEFSKFLQHSKEWTPLFWEKAPDYYRNLISQLPSLLANPENEIPLQQIPTDVQMAFQGWKNYFLEGKEIDRVEPTYREMALFVHSHPHYNRPFWRNIFLQSTPSYLLQLNKATPSEKVPSSELEPMLKVAYFNWEKAKAKPKVETDSSLPSSEAPVEKK